MLAGVAWLARQGDFQTKADGETRLAAAGVLIIRSGLKFIFPEGETALAYFYLYLRYSLIGFWVTGGAPWVFIRVKLAESLIHDPVKSLFFTAIP